MNKKNLYVKPSTKMLNAVEDVFCVSTGTGDVFANTDFFDEEEEDVVILPKVKSPWED